VVNSLYKYEIDYNLYKNFEKEILKEYSIVPLSEGQLFFQVATSNMELKALDIKDFFDLPVKIIVVPHCELEFELQYLFLKQKLFSLATQGIQNHDQQKNNSYIQSFLDEILEFSIDNNASDIHFEVVDTSIVVRLRIDGVLQQYFRFSIKLYYIISSLIKYLGNLDISQKRLPMNSRFSRKVDKRFYDIRISTMPTIDGESIVLRILDNKNTQKRFRDIGFCDDVSKKVQRNIFLKQGLILVTGPTGSGKTTTLYSLLQEINTKEKKVITVEDPVEYKIDGIMQVNINEDIDLGYHTVLKNTLRQDPDVLMIGEIRDTDSLKIAMQASLTGHLVIATLHTNSAVETIVRLFDLGAEPYLISATLKMVLSQRLLRVLCPSCKKQNNKRYQEVGCKDCNFTGFNGRQVVAEILEVDEEIQKAISSHLSNQEINELLKRKDFVSIQQSAKHLVENGDTTQQEFLTKI